MTTSNESTQQQTADRRRRRKALLAGGLVLGVGAAVTFAAWSDDIFASSIFSSDRFAVEGSPDQFVASAYQEYATPTGAQLTFSATKLTPGDTVYAPFSIRTTAPTNVSGELTQVSSYTNGGVLAPYLSYQIFQGATSCTQAAHDGTAWASDDALSGTSATALDAGALTGAKPALQDDGSGNAPGTPQQLCIAVTLQDSSAAKDAINTSTGTLDTQITWDFQATQVQS